MNILITPIDKTSFDEMVARARVELDEPLFENVWLQSKGIDLQQAVNIAQGD